MDVLISEKEKKLLAMANESLTDMISMKDNPKLKTPVRISGHSLEKAVGKIRGTNGIDFTTVRTEKIQVILFPSSLRVVPGILSIALRFLSFLQRRLFWR